MQRLTCSLLILLAPIACGDSGGDTSVSGTTTEQTSGDASTGTSTGSSGDTTSPTTGEPATTDATTTDATTTDATTTVATTDATTDATATNETTDGTTGETTGGTGETTGEGTTGATSPLVIAIVDAELYANCQPVVEPDPVQGSWFVEFDNTANTEATSAVVTGAWLSQPGTPEEIDVSPKESPAIGAGEYVSQEVDKLTGAMHSACDHCGEFYLLELEYDENGVKHHVQEDVTISCAF